MNTVIVSVITLTETTFADIRPGKKFVVPDIRKDNVYTKLYPQVVENANAVNGNGELVFLTENVPVIPMTFMVSFFPVRVYPKVQQD
jgi:hypothetical protein